jgi:hypothetical protein
VPCKHLAYVGVYCLRLGGLHASRHTIWMHPEADAGLESPAEPATKEDIAQLKETLIAEIIVVRGMLQELLSAVYDSKMSKAD